MRDYSELIDYVENNFTKTPTLFLVKFMEWEDVKKYYDFNIGEGGLDLHLSRQKAYTKGNIIYFLEKNIKVAFTSALYDRKMAAEKFHWNLIKMWLWVLEDPLVDDYDHYGLPLFKAVAVKYGFDNPIGNDSGDEAKYGS